MTESTYRLGVDIGGTFTDVVMMRDDGVVFSRKVLSTPDDYSRAIEDGSTALMGQLGAGAEAVTEFVHATTVATNTIIERKGARVALVTTRGFRDVLEIARFRTPRLYDIHYRRPDPLAERRLRFEITERIAADGSVVTPLALEEADALAEELRAVAVDSVAVTLINSHANPAHERRLAERLAALLPGVAVTASVDLLPQLGEYERTSTTVVNAYIRPVVGRYVEALERRLAHMRIGVPLMIMQSSGTVSPGPVVARQPIDIIESGPAAGVLGAAQLGRRIGLADMIVFDMGGTTAKATIIEDHAFALCPETEVGGGAALGTRMLKGAGYPVQVPTIDIAEVGAGGGSIASVDAAGGLQVGPRSAGAAPGPVCYGRGGTQPTVTDANLLLGYLNPDALVSGELALDRVAATAALDALAEQVRMPMVEAAYGIHLIANSTMLRALRSVSSEKGRDPAPFALFAIGGNGPVHAASLAEAAGMTRIVVPPVAGLFSALGMLFADVGHQLVAAFYRRLADVTPDALDAAFAPLRARGAAMLADEGFRDAATQEFAAEVSMKYAGQTAPLPVPVALPVTADGMARMAADFHDLHEATFGYAAPEEPLQLVSVTLRCAGRSATPRMPGKLLRGQQARRPAGTRRAWFGESGWQETAVIARADLSATPRPGPLIVEEYDTTIVVRPGWTAALDPWSNVVLERRA